VLTLLRYVKESNHVCVCYVCCIQEWVDFYMLGGDGGFNQVAHKVRSAVPSNDVQP
jgi:hypothetical protein